MHSQLKVERFFIVNILFYKLRKERKKIMKKSLKAKMLSLMAVCAMAISLLALPVSVAAEETMSGNDFVAQLNQCENGGVIDLEGKTVTLENYLTINKNVTIKNGTFVPAESLKKDGIANPNLITVIENVTLDNVTIKTNDQVKFGLHVYQGSLNAKNLTVDHSTAFSGGAILINKDSNATFTGTLNVTIGENSWYGINVDQSEANFENATLNISGKVQGTKSAVCIDNPSSSSVTGLNLTVVETAVHDNKDQSQVSYVADENLEQFIADKTKEGSDITKVTLKKDVVLNNPLTLAEAMVFEGNGHKLTVNSTNTTRADNNAVNVTSDDVELNDLTIVTTDTVKSGLHVYKVKTTAKNLTVDNTKTLGGACIVINSGDLTLSGTTTLTMGEKSWGGINVDDKYGTATLTFADDSQLVSTANKTVVYADVKDSENPQITLKGLEEVGLLENEDGSYATTIDLKLIAVLDGDLSEEIIIPIPYGSSLTDEDIKALDDMVVNGEFDVEGLIFKGFFLDVNGATKLEANKEYTEDLTIYMIWETQKVDEPDKPTVDVTPTTPDEPTTPAKPETPVQPVQPAEPTKPATPVQPTDTAKPAEPTDKGETVDTGDKNAIALYGSICALAIVGAGIVILKKKREDALNK